MSPPPVETIAIYYTPIAATKIMARFGFATATHMSLVYTDARARRFGATAGPSNQGAKMGPFAALRAVVDSVSNSPSMFGTLVADRHNDTAFEPGSPQDFYTQDAFGDAYPPFVVMRAADLSAQWRRILRVYAAVDGKHLTYSPISQNSNSLAGTALRRARIAIPFSSGTAFAPGALVDLPLD